MLHVRDCPGTTATFDVCPFPWCRKVKHLLYHLVSCTAPEHCKLCSGALLSMDMRRLQYLNADRGKKYSQALAAKAQAAAETTKSKLRATAKPRATAQSKTTKASAGAGKPPAPAAPAASQPNLLVAAAPDSSNSLAALAAAAEALGAEDLESDVLEDGRTTPEPIPVFGAKTEEETMQSATAVDDAPADPSVAASAADASPHEGMVTLEFDTATTGEDIDQEQPTTPVKLEEQSGGLTAAGAEEEKGDEQTTDVPTSPQNDEPATVKTEGSEEENGGVEPVESSTQRAVSVDKAVNDKSEGKASTEPLRVQ